MYNICKFSWNVLRHFISNPYALQIFNPSTCWMLNSRCFYLKYYHQELLGTQFRNGVRPICVILSIFVLNYYKLIDKPCFCIVNVLATIVSSSFVITLFSPIFHDLVSPFIWSKREVTWVCSKTNLTSSKNMYLF